MEKVLADWRTAPVSERLRAAFGFLEKLTLTPGEVGPADVEPLRAAGLSDGAIEEAVRIAALFNLIDRVADALGFAVPGQESFSRAAGHLLRMGYR